MGMTGMEAVLEAVETTLKAKMAAKVTALNAAYADAVVLADVATYAWESRNFAAQEYPAIILDPAKSLPEERYVGAMNERHTLIIFAAVTDSGAKALLKRLFRYARAVREILTTEYDLGGVTNSVSVISTTYSPTYADEKKSRYLRVVAVEIEVIKEEIA